MSVLLSTQNTKALLAALEHLYVPVEAAEFPTHLMEVIEEMLPDTVQAVDVIDRETGRVESELCAKVQNPDGVRAVIAEYILQNPSAAYLHAGGKETLIQPTDFVSQRQFRRTDLYQQAFRPLGIEWQVNVALTIPGKTSGLSVNRGGRKKFRDEEREMLRMLRPHIVGAYANAQLYSALKRAAAERSDEAETLNAGQLARCGLTSRQIEVLQWISEGKRDGEIAVILGIGLRTVHTHVSQILNKLGAETRTGAVYTARERIKTVLIR